MIFDLDVNARGRVLACETDVDIAGALKEQLVVNAGDDQQPISPEVLEKGLRVIARIRSETGADWAHFSGAEGEDLGPHPPDNLDG